MTQQRLMKDGLDKAAITRIAKALQTVLNEFDEETFVKQANRGLKKLELKERLQHIIKALHLTLPDSFPKTAKALCKIPKVWDKGDPNDNLSGFAAWPLTDYVGIYGLEHPKAAFKALEKLTPLFSAEFAIRSFLEQHPDISEQQMHIWAEHKDEHVRRLASEGCRPRLPWGKQLKNYIENPEPIFPILEKLRSDPSLYVRRSVANNLNDIAKDHPDLVIQCCMEWQKLNHEDINWIIKHATRSLVKQGDPRVFPLLGYCINPDVGIEELQITPQKVAIGKELNFSFKLGSLKSKTKRSTTNNVVIDYAVHFMKANGQTAAKVFKLKNLTLAAGDEVKLEKKHSFKLITTRKYYAGKHFLAIHINGVEYVKKPFLLTE